MTRTFTDLALNIYCPYCQALPGDPCETATGNPAATHEERLTPIRTAYWAGYGDLADNL